MTRKLLLSITVIIVVLAGVTGATIAYFSSGVVLGDSSNPNIFQTGNVTVGGFNVTNLNVTGLAPGVTLKIENIGINYTGNLKADLYVGARGTSAPGDPTYFADKLYLRIYRQGTLDVVWEGYVQALSTVWQKLESDTSAGWKAYDLAFTLDADTGNNMQDKTNTDTQILIYAVQTGGTVPTTMPYLTTF